MCAPAPDEEQDPIAADDEQDPIAHFTGWTGELVCVEAHLADGTATIGNTERGGTFPVAEAIETLRQIEAPRPVVAWLEELFADADG